MRTLTLIYLVLVLCLSMLSSAAAVAADSFFQVGKTYLFTPRTNLVMKGTVSQVTDHEIVFVNRSILKASKTSANAKDEATRIAQRGAAIAEYLKSNNKPALLEASPIQNIPTSYSRSEMTAIRIDG